MFLFFSMKLQKEIPEDAKTVAYQDVIDQRLALAKWMASNREQRKLDVQSYERIAEILFESELFGIEADKEVVITDEACACANSILLSIVKLEVKPQEILEVSIRPDDVGESDRAAFVTRMLLKRKKEKHLASYLRLRQLLSLLLPAHND